MHPDNATATQPAISGLDLARQALESCEFDTAGVRTGRVM
jgi:hypothetical protein